MILDITGGWVRPKCATKRNMSIYLVYIINAEGIEHTHKIDYMYSGGDFYLWQ
jgi:hypothetical protein